MITLDVSSPSFGGYTITRSRRKKKIVAALGQIIALIVAFRTIIYSAYEYSQLVLLFIVCRNFRGATI
jgi:hypothetical protein